MKKLLTLLTTLILSSVVAQGELYIYNWTGYTNEEMVAKFTQETGIRVILDTFDSNETLLSRLKSGATGYDIVVPTHNFVQIFVQEGLLEPINATQLENYSNIDPRWQNPDWDPGNVYTVPWNWGSTSFNVNTAIYDGPLDSFELLFKPPTVLHGRIGMLDSWDEVVPMALRYLGYDSCETNPQAFAEVLQLLEAQKPFVKMYNSEGVVENIVAGEVDMHTHWNGATLRARREIPTIRYVYPTEGVSGWMDNLAVAKGAPNYENALTFINWFLQPENAAMQSNFAGYANGVVGSEAFLLEDLRTAAEVVAPADALVVFAPTCPPEYVDLASRVWTRLKQ